MMSSVSERSLKRASGTMEIIFGKTGELDKWKSHMHVIPTISTLSLILKFNMSLNSVRAPTDTHIFKLNYVKKNESVFLLKRLSCIMHIQEMMSSTTWSMSYLMPQFSYYWWITMRNMNELQRWCYVLSILDIISIVSSVAWKLVVQTEYCAMCF